MSVSDMNVSWSSAPTNRSHKDGSDNSVFLTSVNSARAQRQPCVSAKHSGMRFQSWREPKPLRSRCSSAVVVDSFDVEQEKIKPTARSAGRAPVSARQERPHSEMCPSEKRKEVLERISQPTASSKWKSSKGRAREVGTDMNYYSWSKMNVYKAYMGVIYGSNGTMKKSKPK